MPRQKYEQIYSTLKAQIEAGDYPVGGLLPSENVLVGEFQCSRNTVRRALANLVRDGYVQTRQGWGVCNIYQPIETSAYTMGTIESFAETARRTGQNSATRVVLFTTCTKIICRVEFGDMSDLHAELESQTEDKWDDWDDEDDEIQF